MAWLPDGEKFSKISLFVLTQLTNVADTQTNRQTPHDSIHVGRAYASIASRGKNVQRKSCEFWFIRGFYSVCVYVDPKYYKGKSSA